MILVTGATGHIGKELIPLLSENGQSIRVLVRDERKVAHLDPHIERAVGDLNDPGMLASGAPVVGFLVAGLLLRRIPSWQRFGNWLILGSPLTLVLVILSLATFDQSAVVAGYGVAGLTERILCVELAAWFSALGWQAFRHA